MPIVRFPQQISAYDPALVGTERQFTFDELSLRMRIYALSCLKK
jgi:hypothetical protein